MLDAEKREARKESIGRIVAPKIEEPLIFANLDMEMNIDEVW